MIIGAPATKEHLDFETLAVPIRGGIPIKVCYVCSATWSPDGKFLYVGSILSAGPTLTGRTFAMPVPPGKALPHLPVGGINVSRSDGGAARGRDNRGRSDLARTRPLDLLLHQDRFAAQSLSHTPALSAGAQLATSVLDPVTVSAPPSPWRRCAVADADGDQRETEAHRSTMSCGSRSQSPGRLSDCASSR